MLCFIVTGRIGRIETLADGSLRIAVGYERESAGTEWVCCACLDRALSARLAASLNVGTAARLEGQIEPRRREIAGRAVYDVVFVVTRFDRLLHDSLQ
ncbi:MAG: hypothetical protein BroJett013_26000 [Alphaproteobacteria bacterium]|nr:MAG: hypothetical protein BroJett013_26000 [Alphaproteobacteria bacterium]